MKTPPTPYQSYTHERNYGCRVSEWTLRGWKAIVLENNLLRITVLPDKGTDIYEFLYKPLDLDVMFRTPIGLRDRSKIIAPMQLSSGQMMDYFFGGWFEMFPNAGYTFEHQGFPWGLHGEVSLQAWDVQVIEDSPQSVAVKFSLRTFRTLFRLEKTIRLVYDSPAVFFEENITNEAAQPIDTSWGQHPCFGWPFIDETCRVYVPPCRVLTYHEKIATTTRFAPGQDAEWPYVKSVDGKMIDASHIPGPEAASQDHLYMTGYDDGWYAVNNLRLGVGFAMRFDPRLYRYLTFWQVYRGAPDYPWWGTTYNIALEPQTSYPNTLPEQLALGNALHFAPGETVSTRYLAAIYTGRGEVSGVTDDGEAVMVDGR